MIARLLVEGSDDKNVISHLLGQNGFELKQKDRFTVQMVAESESILEIKDKDGFNNQLDTLGQELRASELSRLGIVIDADDSLADRWRGIRARLLAAGYNSIRDLLDATGTIVTAVDRVPVGIWIMPDNRVDGVLEHFVAKLIPDDDGLWPRAQQAVDDIPQSLRRFLIQAKAEIHTWLAWQEEPGARLGSAINQRYLQSDTPTAVEFVKWINRFLSA